MTKLSRVIEIDGHHLFVPRYVNRTVSGWQARVRGVPSQHFADAHYGDAECSLRAAENFAKLAKAGKLTSVLNVDLSSEIDSLGYLDLSDELEPHQNGFKALSWWKTMGGNLHAFMTVGVVAEPLINGYRSMAEQFSDAMPWLHLHSVAMGYIKPMDVFALNCLKGALWMDFAGVYLGAFRPDRGLTGTTGARVLLETSPIGLRRDAVNLLWNLWLQEPYACPEEFTLEYRATKSAHCFTRNFGETILTTKSETSL